MQRLTLLKFSPKKLRAAREAKDLGLSQAAGLVGVSRQLLFTYEHGSAPNPDILLRLCVLYDVDLRDLGNRRAA
jgi:transcriptional regulator with XRE-family HTH domain